MVLVDDAPPNMRIECSLIAAHKPTPQEQQDASPQPIRTTAKPVKHDDDADGHTPDNTPLIGVPDVSPPQRPTLFMRIPSTRSLHSTCSMEHTDSIPDELPRLGTAQAPHPAEAPIQMPTAYSMSDSLPSSSQLGIKLGSRTLSSLFRDGSEGRVEQNYWSLDDDAMSSSGQSSVNSPCRNNDTGTARAGGGDGGVDAYGVHMVFPGTTVGGPPSLQATGVIASNPFVTDSPFFDEGGAMDGGATDGGDGGVKPVGVRTDSSTSGGVHSSGALGVKVCLCERVIHRHTHTPTYTHPSTQASASSQSSTTTGGALARGSGADRTAGGGGADNGSGGGGGGGQGPWRTLSGGSKRSRQVLEQPCLAIELHVTEGPCSGVRYHADDTTTQVLCCYLSVLHVHYVYYVVWSVGIQYINSNPIATLAPPTTFIHDHQYTTLPPPPPTSPNTPRLPLVAWTTTPSPLPIKKCLACTSKWNGMLKTWHGKWPTKAASMAPCSTVTALAKHTGNLGMRIDYATGMYCNSVRRPNSQ